MLTRLNRLSAFIAVCGMICLGPSAALAQHSIAEFQKILSDRANFEETDFAALEQGESVVRLLPVKDKREVAVCGLVNLNVPAELFLQSFRESMTQKNNPAILEIGRFSGTPTIADLQSLTFEERDIEDLKECVVGNCKLKLSAMMIERLHEEVSWEAADYRAQATRLLKLMLVEYVRDYLARGDVALIQYNDKSEEIRMAEEQRALMTAPGYINKVLPEFPHQLKGFAKSELSLVEDAIVWSKIKFGLKPVITFNHIKIYRRVQESGPQILIASKQIYANHYFDSSLALTAFVNLPGASAGSYLFYENRSRADGLEGVFGKIKRGMVEDKAVNGLKMILENSKASLSARTVRETETAADEAPGWRRWKFGRVHVFLLGLIITAFVALFALGNYGWKGNQRGTAPLT